VNGCETSARSGREELGSRGDVGLDRADDLRALLDDLVGDLPAVHIDLTREIEGDADPVALDGRDAHHADRIAGISDHHLFPLPSCDDQHADLPAAGAGRHGEYTTLGAKGKGTPGI